MVDFFMIDFAKKRNFLFDMDGTMVDLELLNYTCFREASNKETSVDLSFPEYMKYMAGVGSRRGFTTYFESVSHNPKNIEEIIGGYRKRKEFYLLNHFNEVVSIKDGLTELLIKARSRGIKLAVATSTIRKFTDIILRRAGLEMYFDTIVTVDDVAKTKPAPDIFLKALSNIQGELEESLIFEDSANGVKSAENSGMDFYVVRNLGKNDEVVSSHENVITSYKELLSELG
jgi:HAD superfamily hydrolase (TIGR01509 family)